MSFKTYENYFFNDNKLHDCVFYSLVKRHLFSVDVSIDGHRWQKGKEVIVLRAKRGCTTMDVILCSS